MGIGGSLELIDPRIKQGRFDVDALCQGGAGRHPARCAIGRPVAGLFPAADPGSEAHRCKSADQRLGGAIQRTVGPAVRLKFVADAGLWNTFVDPGQLESAVLNLCINARDAMPAGGTLTIETANRWLDDRVALERELSPDNTSHCASAIPAPLCLRDRRQGF